MAKWPWRSRSMTPIFNNSWENPKMHSCANLVILAQIQQKLWHGQAKFPRILSQNEKNCLEGQGQWSLFSIPAENIPGCMYGANLVIPAQICDKVLCGQGKVYGRTHRRGQWQYPFGLKGQGIMICDSRSRFLTSVSDNFWLSSSLQRYLTTTNSRSQVSCADAASISNPIWWRDVAICWNPVVYRLSILWYLGKQMKYLTHCGLVLPYGNIDLGEHSMEEYSISCEINLLWTSDAIDLVKFIQVTWLNASWHQAIA